MGRDRHADVLEIPQQIVEGQKRFWSKLRRLRSDKVFRDKTEQMRRRLDEAYLDEPEQVRAFFKRFFYPMRYRVKDMNGFLTNVKDGKVRQVLSDYVSYVARFGVGFRLRRPPAGKKETEKKSRFAVTVAIPPGPKFHVKVVDRLLRPMVLGDPDEDIMAFCEVDEVEMAPKTEKQVDSGLARFVRIEDKRCASLLAQLEELSYDPDGVVYIQHMAEQPYFLCLIGENVPKAKLRQLGTAATEFQQSYFGRGKAGRPRNVSRWKKAVSLLDQPSPLKTKAIEISKGDSAEAADSGQRHLSRVKKKLK